MASLEEQLATLQRETRSSIEVTRNAKGDYQWVIKRYFDQEDGDASAVALQEIQWIDADLRLKYLTVPQ